VVELPPAVLPAGLDGLRLDGGKRCPQALLAGGVGIGGELDAACPIALLEALRDELEQPRAGLLGPRGRDRDPDAAQPAQLKALRSRSKKPSSGR
jgi:hypothetical protein